MLRTVAPTRRPWREVLFRAAAVALGLAPLVLCEVLFTVLDWGRSSLHDDPFVGFSAVHPLFVLDKTGTRYEISPAHYRFFRPESFAKAKPPGEFRVFCLGDSTVQGRPFAIETSFTTWLEISLRAADPTRSWEVVNCGGVSYASYRLVPIMKELLSYQPDLFIVHVGHNEFLEDRTYQHLKQVPESLLWPLAQLSRLRTFGVLNTGMSRLIGWPGEPVATGRAILGPEVDALLDYQGGLEAYHRDEQWRRDVIRHYEFNLGRMVRMAREAGVPMLLMNPVSNLDTPPFKALHRDGLTAEDLREFDSLWDEARQHFETNMSLAIELLRQAIAIDDQHAGIHYTLAKCYQRVGRIALARQEFVRAKDLDICPLRILEPMNQIVLAVGRETGTPLIDLMAWFSERSEGGIPGGDRLVDHVHPSITGHQHIAELLAGELIRLGFVHPVPGWEAERDRRSKEHLASLDDAYYLLGQKRLGNLRLWSQGRGNRLRAHATDSLDAVRSTAVIQGGF